MLYELSVPTKGNTEFVDITDRIKELLSQNGVSNGICTVFVPHTTAGITINENADPDVVHDMLKELNKVIPLDDKYRHLEGNSAAHIKASIMGFSEHIIINDGHLLLGTWQGIYFTEFDGPRHRKIYIKIIEA